jgi:hypothetical protein
MFTMLGSEEGQAKGLPLERKKEEEKESKLQVESESTPLSVRTIVSTLLINSNQSTFINNQKEYNSTHSQLYSAVSLSQTPP